MDDEDDDDDEENGHGFKRSCASQVYGAAQPLRLWSPRDVHFHHHPGSAGDLWHGGFRPR